MRLVGTEASEAGYTLAEALAAMLIIGLTMGVLFQGVQSIGKLQARTSATVSDVRALALTERALTQLLSERAALDAGLAGDQAGFAFDCSAGVCSATLSGDRPEPTLQIVRGKAAQSYVMPIQRPVKLVYEGTDGRYDSWPPAERQVALRGVSVVGAAGGESPLIVAWPWIEQPRTCEFDMIARACRPTVRVPTRSTP